MTSAPPGVRRPNILFLLSDDHAAHSISAYGSVLNTTPHIDAIGEAGVRFENLFATNSLCSPSRASLLTGTYSHVNGVSTLDTFIDASQPTFVSALRDAGYRTGFVGKWHMGDGETDGVGHDPQGFDYWDVLIDQGEYHDPRFLSADGLRVEPGYATDLITDLAIRWLGSLEGDAPWCLLVWHKAPHRPWEPDDAHTGLYADREIPVPGTFTDDFATRSDTARRAVMSVADDLTEVDLKQPVPQGLSREDEARWKYQRYMEDYLACVASVDDNVGRLVGWLRDRWRPRRHRAALRLRPGLLPRRPRLVRQAVHVRGVDPDAVPRVVPACGPTRGRRIPASSATSTSPRPCSRRPASRPTHGCRGARSGPTSPTPATPNRPTTASTTGTGCTTTAATTSARTTASAPTGTASSTSTTTASACSGCSDERYPPEWELYDLVEDPHQLSNVADDPAYASVRADLERRLWRVQAAVGDEPHPDQPRPVDV